MIQLIIHQTHISRKQCCVQRFIHLLHISSLLTSSQKFSTALMSTYCKRKKVLQFLAHMSEVLSYRHQFAYCNSKKEKE